MRVPRDAPCTPDGRPPRDRARVSTACSRVPPSVLGKGRWARGERVSMRAYLVQGRVGQGAGSRGSCQRALGCASGRRLGRRCCGRSTSVVACVPRCVGHLLCVGCGSAGGVCSAHKIRDCPLWRVVCGATASDHGSANRWVACCDLRVRVDSTNSIHILHTDIHITIQSHAWTHNALDTLHVTCTCYLLV